MDNSSAAIDYQASQISIFMAGINKDLEEHVLSKSAKYAFNFETETPLQGTAANNDFQWFEVSNFSKSEEATGKKPRINANSAANSNHQFNNIYDRASTGDTTLHSI